MASSIREFWRRLDSSVHPDDREVFDMTPGHTFDLQFPPPAFIGDIDEAPIVVLMANGGYKPGETEAEFPNEASVLGYLAYLRGETAELPAATSRYYTGKALGEHIANGTVAMVNSVAYRSPKLSAEPGNIALAKRLPSLQVHRHWLHREMVPAALCRRRYLFVHRRSLWALEPSQYVGPNIRWSDSRRAEPNRPLPDKERIAAALAWLASFQAISSDPERGLPRIEAEFASAFQQWNITLPVEDVAERRSGKIAVEGWKIDYSFGEDGDGVYLDYAAGHRMLWGENRNRLRESGEGSSLRGS